MATKFNETAGFTSTGMAQEIESVIQFQTRQRKMFERRWYDNNFFDDGFHYRFVSQSTGKIIDLSEQGTAHIPQRAIPKASRQIRGVANLMFANEFVPVIYPEKITQVNFPNQNDFLMAQEASKKSAKRIGNWIEFEWDKLSIKEKLTLMILLTSKHGVSFLQVYPDPVREKVCAEVFDAFDIYVKGDLYDIYRSPYIGKVLATPVTEIIANENFDEAQRSKINPDNRYASSEVKQAYMNTRYGYQMPSIQNGTGLLKEFFFKEYLSEKNWETAVSQADESGAMEGKSKGDPIIRQVFSANGVWLKDGYVNLSEYPFVDLRFEPGAIYQVPLIERFIPANKIYDSVMSRVERYIGTQIVGIWMRRKGENFHVNNVSGGQVIEYDTTKPEQMQMAPMPSFVFNFLGALDRIIEEQGAAAASLNQIPSGVRSGDAIESLKATDYANLKIPIDQLKLTVKRITERIIECASNYYLNPQEVSLMSQGQPNYFDVIGEKGMAIRKEAGLNTNAEVIKKNIRVNVEVESGLGFTEEGKRGTMKGIMDYMIQLAQMGLLTTDAVKVVLDRFMSIFQFGSTAEFMEAMDKGTASAPLNEDQMAQLKTAVLEALKDAGEIGQEASDKRIEESALGALQALRDSGVLDKKEQPQQENKQPSQSISFKDLPPEGKTQMAAKAGIQITPQQAKQQDQNNKPVLKPNGKGGMYAGA